MPRWSPCTGPVLLALLGLACLSATGCSYGWYLTSGNGAIAVNYPAGMDYSAEFLVLVDGQAASTVYPGDQFEMRVVLASRNDVYDHYHYDDWLVAYRIYNASGALVWDSTAVVQGLGASLRLTIGPYGTMTDRMDWGLCDTGGHLLPAGDYRLVPTFTGHLDSGTPLPSLPQRTLRLMPAGGG